MILVIYDFYKDITDQGTSYLDLSCNSQQDMFHFYMFFRLFGDINGFASCFSWMHVIFQVFSS